MNSNKPLILYVDDSTASLSLVRRWLEEDGYQVRTAEYGNADTKGRIGVHEILAPDDALRQTIGQKGVTADVIKRQAIERGMTSLYLPWRKLATGLCRWEKCSPKSAWKTWHR